jgi:hypothetical protein
MFVCGVAALVSGDDYMTFHQNFAVINITYSNGAADVLSSEVSTVMSRIIHPLVILVFLVLYLIILKWGLLSC